MSVIGKRAAISDVQIVRAQNACNYCKDNAHQKGQVGCGPKTALSVPTTALQSRKPAAVVYCVNQHGKEHQHPGYLVPWTREQLKSKEEEEQAQKYSVKQHTPVHTGLLSRGKTTNNTKFSIHIVSQGRRRGVSR